MSKIIFLIGMPGAGKTSWGRKVAGAFKLRFVDLDQYMEEKCGESITELFDSFGEMGFRQKEAIALEEVIAGNEKPFILSCGGGTPMLATNLELMRTNGCVIYLRAEMTTIMENLRRQPGHRPLLNDVVDPMNRVSELYEKRRKVYEQADYILDVEQLTISDFELIVKECTRQH